MAELNNACVIPEEAQVKSVALPTVSEPEGQKSFATPLVNKVLEFLDKNARVLEREAHLFVEKQGIYYTYHYYPELYSPSGFKALVIKSDSVMSEQSVYTLINQNNEIDRITGYLGKDTKFNISGADLTKFSIVAASTLNYLAEVLLESQKKVKDSIYD